MAPLICRKTCRKTGYLCYIVIGKHPYGAEKTAFISKLCSQSISVQSFPTLSDNMNKLFKVLSLCFCLLLANFQLAEATENSVPDKQKKCKAPNIKGTWYGDYYFIETGNTYAMVLEVTSLEGCQVKGSVHWPNYFNSKTRFEGEIQDGALIFREKELLQGYEMDLKGEYMLQLSAGDSLTGTCFYEEGKQVARVQLVNRQRLEPTQAQEWDTKIADWTSRNGTASIGTEQAQYEKILVKYRELQASQKMPSEAIEVKGRCEISQLELPLYAVFDFPHKFYMEMEFQNLKFRIGKTEMEEWEFNPIEDKLSVRDRNLEEGNDGFYFSGNPLLKCLDQGYTVSRVNLARLDSIDTYRLLLEKDDNKKAFFLNSQNYRLQRMDEDYAVKLLLNYRQVEDLDFPTLYYQISGKDANLFQFNEISINPLIKAELFEVPEELKGKQQNSPVSEGISFNESGNEKFEQGKYQEAIQDYDKAIRLAPNNITYYLNRGKAKKESEDYYGALGDFDHALKLDPNNTEAYNWKGLSKYLIGDYENALKDFARTIEIDSTYQMGYYNMGYTYMEMGDYAKAEEKFSLLVKLDSLNAENLMLDAICLLNLERYEESLQIISQAIAAGDESADTYNYRGVAYYSLQEYDNALEDFTYALSKDSTDAVKYFNQGNTYLELEQLKEAIQSYENALPLTEEKDEIFYRMGICYYEQQDFGNALDFLSKAIESNPRNASYFDNRALVRNALMDYAGAIDDYSSSIALYPDDQEIYFLRGLLNIRVHNKNDGCKDLQKASILGHEDAPDMLKKHCSVEVSDTEE